ncbi:MAG: acyl-CoA dehydrogenase C-terminal domain-containing protein, partial [Pseudomonadota bacterium]|nr:acyl-CoA dehydrogenase C-terminal domain-containing protein [Pseudomonadota bacterium]
EWITKMAKQDPLTAAASAVPFLRLMGNVAGGYYLLNSAAIAQREMAGRTGDPAFFSNKVIIARFYAEHVLPSSAGLAITVMEGSSVTLAAHEGVF